MRKLAFVLALALIYAPALFAQGHGEIGAFADYVRLHHANDANFWGLGGRIGFGGEHVQIEGEMSYDFEQTFDNTVTNAGGTAGTISIVPTRLRLLHGLFGPKFQTGSQAIRAFVVVKGGFLNFSVANRLANLGTNFSNAVGSVPEGDTNGALYPGGGVEFFAGPVGLRIEAGDLMYFDRGANHNLRFTFGPVFRF